MDEQEYKIYFVSLTRDQLEEAAVALALDCDRLRLELDAAQGVIR